MTLLLGCLALFFPRLVIIVTFLFSDYLGRAYQTNLWPVLGFIFMPLTTLAYAFAKNQNGDVSGIYLVLVIIAVLIDLGIIGGSAKRGRTYIAAHGRAR
jgi:hypothetical protein